MYKQAGSFKIGYVNDFHTCNIKRNIFYAHDIKRRIRWKSNIHINFIFYDFFNITHVILHVCTQLSLSCVIPNTVQP